ncbi:MAG: SulP family inorganic anion transporter, partial [Flavobacteriales bacterium]|nr:SulP family inorganic anion transporter [Flavobacteriales bacterium]
MTSQKQYTGPYSGIPKDLLAGTVVFLVALPLCLGIALASGAPMFAGIISGIIGGIVVGSLSGSHTSVSGPAAGLTAIIATQILELGSFQAFLLATVFAGVFQVIMGFFRAGFIAAFFPSTVIKGLLAAIGIILILKQIPHLLGHDPDLVGEMAFIQPDGQSTFSELIQTFFSIQPGAAMIGLLSLGFLFFWDKVKRLKENPIPSALLVVLLGIFLNYLMKIFFPEWEVTHSHLVQLPIAANSAEAFAFIQLPDFSQLINPSIYLTGFVVAMVASLETLLNLEAVDKLDPLRRHSPPNR